MSNNYEAFKFDLIEKVRAFPAIWDKGHEQHHNRYVLHQHWKKISQDVDMKEQRIKRFWKTLRREFGNQAKKVQQSGVETLETANPQWPYYHSLLFLKDQFDLGDTGSNATEPDAEIMDAYDEDHDGYDYDEGDMSEPSLLLETPPKRESRPRYRHGMVNQELMRSRSPVNLAETSRTCSNGSSFFGYGINPHNAMDSHNSILNRMPIHFQEKLRRRQVAEKIDDEDDGFFNSLLPYVRQLQPQQKMMFRLQVQHQLYEILYGLYNPQHSSANPDASSGAFAYLANHQQ